MTWNWLNGYGGWLLPRAYTPETGDAERLLGSSGRLLRMQRETGLGDSDFEEYLGHLEARRALANQLGKSPDSELEAKIRETDEKIDRLLRFGAAMQPFPRY